MNEGGRRDGKIVASSLGSPSAYLVRPVLHLVKEDVMPAISPLTCLHIAFAALPSVIKSSVNQLLGMLPVRTKGSEFSCLWFLNSYQLNIKSGCACIPKNTADDNLVKSLVLSFFAMREVIKTYSFGESRRVECFR
jgi:hypothetical protein